MKKLLEGAILPSPFKIVWKIYGPPLMETALIFLTNYMTSGLHLNYFLISFTLFQDSIGCVVTILICGRLVLFSNMMITSCLESQRHLLWTCGFIREGPAESAFTCITSSTVFHFRVCSFSV